MTGSIVAFPWRAQGYQKTRWKYGQVIKSPKNNDPGAHCCVVTMGGERLWPFSGDCLGPGQADAHGVVPLPERLVKHVVDATDARIAEQATVQPKREEWVDPYDLQPEDTGDATNRPLRGPAAGGGVAELRDIPLVLCKGRTSDLSKQMERYISCGKGELARIHSALARYKRDPRYLRILVETVEHGHSTSEMAREEGLTPRRVRQIRREALGVALDYVDGLRAEDAA